MNLTTIAAIQPPFSSEDETVTTTTTETSAAGAAGTSASTTIVECGFAYLEYALRHGARFCCLPENFNVFGSSNNEALATCENSSDVLQRALELSRDFEAYIVVPLLICDSGNYYNRAYIAGPTGSTIGWYDKIHTTECERNEWGLQSGSVLPVFDIDGIRIAIAICYDLYFPEFFSALVALEPDIVFIPSLQRSDDESANEARMRTRAMDTMAYVVRAGYGCQIDLSWTKKLMFGQSCIVHPDGTILSNAGHYEGIAAASVQLPFDWKRPRCGGGAAEPVRRFIGEDRLSVGYVTKIVTVS